MPKLIIDDIAVEVAPGTSVLEAARSVGIVIPHFCYHPALAIAAACRLCAVKLLDGPVKGIQMSCALPAQDGMVVSTTDPEAVKMRSLVIEWLMINHPHDCPVCDEGGECLLQDYTIAGGHSRRRYQGKKRTFLNQYLGEYIQHEMNRCIECYRCARFYQDYAGGTDFGVTGSAGRVYFGRVADGALESPFSGNLVDICPTGVFTDKTGRFRARYWDYQMGPSVCPHCSVGCNTTPQCYHRELLKVIARRNDQVNGWFICDRGRFEKSAVNDVARPRTATVDGAPATREAALDAAVERITRFVRENGAERLAFVGSDRLSMEGGVLLARLCRHFPGSSLCYFGGQADSQGALAAAELLTEGNSASLPDVQKADAIAILCSDLMEQGPMVSLAIRHASLKGARVFLVAPDAGSEEIARFPFPCTVVRSVEEAELAQAERGVVVCYAPETNPALLKKLAQGPAKLAVLQRGPNSFGAALLTREYGAVPFSEALAQKGIKGVLTVEADLSAGELETVAVVAAADWKPSAACARGSVVLPTTSWVESEGTYVNFEGRAQRFGAAMHPGLPIRGLDPHNYGTFEVKGAPDGTLEAPLHPPRVPRALPPGGEGVNAARLLSELLERLSGEPAGAPYTGKWSVLQAIDPDGGGVRILEAVKH